MSDMIILLLIPIAGLTYCVLRRRPVGQYVGWIGVFLIILALNLIHVPGMLPSIMCIVGIGLLVFVCWDPFDWFSLARIDMEFKYPEYYGKKKTVSSNTSYNPKQKTSYSGSSSSYTPSSTYSSYSPVSYTPAPRKGPYKEIVSNVSMREVYSRFFGAVSDFQEVNGSGSVIIQKNDDGKTISFLGHYCNYENMDCAHRISSYLSFPGLYMPGSGESGDMFQYSLEKIECPDSEFGIQGIMSVLTSRLPNARITGQTSRDDFCSVQFQT